MRIASPTPAAVVALAVAAVAALYAPAAWAGWSPATQIGGGDSGSLPVLAFGPGGDAAVASTGVAGATYLVRRPAKGAFSPPVTVAAASSAPQQVLLPAGGATVLLVGGAPWFALVQAPGARAGGTEPFAQPQELAPEDSPEALGTNAVMLATARGDVIAVLDGDSATVGGYTMILPRGSTSFGAPGLGPEADNPSTFSVAADDVGGAFVAWPGGIAYRRPGGRFVALRGLSRPPGRAFIGIDAAGVGAGGDGSAALAYVYGLDRAGAPAGRVAIQLGRRGSLGRPHVLASTQYVANTYLVSRTPLSPTLNLTGPIVDAQGNVTIAWGQCGARGLGCSIAGATGNVRGSLGPSQTLARTPRVANITIRALVGDRDVAVERCGPGARCSISIAFANRRRQFGKAQKITGDAKQLELLADDAHADQLLVWRGSNDGLYAAVRPARSSRFGAPHRLSAPQVGVGNVAGAFGPRGEAIVAWTEPDIHALFAAAYVLPR